MEVYLGIGGNLGDRLQNIKDVIQKISDRIAVPEKVSSIYLSEPWGFEHAKYFTNAVIKVQTNKTPEQVLEIILSIESDLKRVRSKSGYQGRTMDIDILYFGNKIIKNKNLEVPHPRINNRLFVLLPLKDIDKYFIDPVNGKTIDEMLNDCTDIGKIKNLQYGT